MSPSSNALTLTSVDLFSDPNSGNMRFGCQSRTPALYLCPTQCLAFQPVGGADKATLPAQQETEIRAREMGRAQRSWWMSSFYPIVSASLGRCSKAFSGIRKSGFSVKTVSLKLRMQQKLQSSHWAEDYSCPLSFSKSRTTDYCVYSICDPELIIITD